MRRLGWLTHLVHGSGTRSRALGAVLLVVSCDPRKEASDLASAATAKAEALASAAKDQARTAARDGITKAKRELFGLTDSGALSEGATAWITKQADADAALAVVGKGAQLAPVAFEAAKVVNQAVDDETAIEPIFQKIEPGKEGDVDKAIGGMPKVEVIDGVKVGFKKLDGIESTKLTKEQAAVVLWRKDDHLIGFVYRTKRTIDLEVLVKEAPRLVRLTQSALK
ncbi:MAG: hypothetical protein JNL21_41115 [Myxococcales bacterium]|nr:hypothetical protein [Myxococcales bacterium]